MLWVRIPPELLATKHCPRGAAWSARLPVTQEIVGSNPIGDARQHGTQTWQSGEAQTFATLWVRLPPVLLQRVVFLVAACKTVVTKQARWTTRGSIPSRPTDKWPVRLTAGC